MQSVVVVVAMLGVERHNERRLWSASKFKYIHSIGKERKRRKEGAKESGKEREEEEGEIAGKIELETIANEKVGWSQFVPMLSTLGRTVAVVVAVACADVFVAVPAQWNGKQDLYI